MAAEMKKMAKKCGQIGLALLAGLVVPLLIMAATVQGLWQLYREWRIIRAGLVKGNFVCSLNTDCPPGYACISGKCVPQATA